MKERKNGKIRAQPEVQTPPIVTSRAHILLNFSNKSGTTKQEFPHNTCHKRCESNQQMPSVESQFSMNPLQCVERMSTSLDSPEFFANTNLSTVDGRDLEVLSDLLHRHLPHIARERMFDLGHVDKIFASTWLTEEMILVGTKNNMVSRGENIMNASSALFKRIVFASTHTRKHKSYSRLAKAFAVLLSTCIGQNLVSSDAALFS